MAVFSLIGITGIYLRQVRQTGVLGLIGYAVLALGYLTILCVQVIAVFVLPDLATSQPGYVNDVLAVATSGTPIGDVSRMQTLNNVLFTYIVGGVIFGIALFRANVLARWAAALMSLGAVATVATFVLPELVQRLFAIPASVALIGLGYSLWREQRTHKASRPDPSGQLGARPGRGPMTTQAATLPPPTGPIGSVGPVDRLGAVRLARPRPAPGRLRLLASGRAGRRPAADARRPALHLLAATAGRAHRRRPRLRRSRRVPVLRDACVDVGPGGTGRRDGFCWCSGWRSHSRRCG